MSRESLILGVAAILVPVQLATFGYAVSIEQRLTRVETILEVRTLASPPKKGAQLTRTAQIARLSEFSLGSPIPPKRGATLRYEALGEGGPPPCYVGFCGVARPP